MKRFLFISAMAGTPWGGSEELWAAAALRLRKQGHDVAAMVQEWRPDPPAITRLAQAGVQIFRRGRPRTAWARIQDRFERTVRPASDARRHVRRLHPYRPDLCILSQGGNFDAIEWAEAVAADGWPYVTVAQAAVECAWPSDDLSIRLASMAAGARRNFFVSEANLRLTALQAGGELPKGAVIRNPFGVPYEANPPWPTGEELRLACVGRWFAAAKGQDLLFEVLAQPRWRDRPYQLNLFGDGPNRRVFEGLIRNLRLERVHLAGHRSPEAIWADHHALVLPSRYEGLPLVIVEAMLSQRPCIVTRAGGSAEAIRDNDNGFVAAAPTVELLDEALERAWNRRSEWREIGLRAGQHIRTLVPPDPAGNFAAELLQLAG